MRHSAACRTRPLRRSWPPCRARCAPNTLFFVTWLAEQLACMHIAWHAAHESYAGKCAAWTMFSSLSSPCCRFVSWTFQQTSGCGTWTHMQSGACIVWACQACRKPRELCHAMLNAVLECHMPVAGMEPVSASVGRARHQYVAAAKVAISTACRTGTRHKRSITAGMAVRTARQRCRRRPCTGLRSCTGRMCGPRGWWQTRAAIRPPCSCRWCHCFRQVLD